MISAGTYRARATQVLLAQVGKKKTPAMQVNFQIQDEGEHHGASIRWDGWLTTDKAQERTIESLQYCGWSGDDITVFTKEGVLDGCDLNDVEIVVAMEPYEGDDEKLKGKEFPRVQWVNKLGGRGINVENAMPVAEATAFAAKMKGLVHKVKSKNPTATPATASANGGKAF